MRDIIFDPLSKIKTQNLQITTEREINVRITIYNIWAGLWIYISGLVVLQDDKVCEVCEIKGKVMLMSGL